MAECAHGVVSPARPWARLIQFSSMVPARCEGMALSLGRISASEGVALDGQVVFSAHSVPFRCDICI